jgi:hypothetical protein
MSDTQFQTALSLYGQGRSAEGARMLGEAAEGGNVPAMTLYGHYLLTGRDMRPDPVRGARMVVAAAERGGPLACTITAALLAIGAGGPPDWPRALDYLARGAELGFQVAQAQLRLLAGRDGDDWRALRDAIDIEAWRAAPEPHPICEDPRVWAFEQVASPAVCDWLIAQSRDRLKPATVYTVAGGLALSSQRNNSFAQLSVADADLVTLAVRERLAACADLEVTHMDSPQVLHYAVGQQFVPHVDFFDPAVASQAQEIATAGQRVATGLVYLNDEGLEGGETDFPRLGFRHRGRKGDLLVFFNVDAAGQADRRTLHAGLSPTRGEKWVLSQWFRDRAPPGAVDPQLAAALNGR